MSRLFLPNDELKICYTRYLLLKEICPIEIALFILLLGIQQRRENAFACFFSYNLYEINENKKALSILDSLEDCFINPVVMAMSADLNRVSDRICHDKIRNVRDILSLREESSLSVIELYFKAYTLEFSCVSQEQHTEIIRLYKVCITKNFQPSFGALEHRLLGR